MNRLPLGDLQRWMAHVVQHPAGAAAAIRSRAGERLLPRGDLTNTVATPHGRTATQGLQAYSGGYLTRLHEVMASDYPAVCHAVGPDTFRDLVQAYVRRHPSRHPNLNRLGVAFPRWLASRRSLPQRAFVTELARLERAISDAFDAAEFTPLDLSARAHWTQAQWATARLPLNPSVRLLALRHPVGGYYRAFLDHEEPAVPPPAKAWMAVFRKDDKVWRHALPAGRYRVLHALHAGRTLGDAVAAADDATAVGAWFQEWAADGLFVDAVTS